MNIPLRPTMSERLKTTRVMHSTGVTGAPVSLYYETFEPLSPTDKPVVIMIHGGAHSGACYQATADGRPGWAYVFAQRGYPVVVPDWPGIGRSGHVPIDKLTGEVVVEGLSALVRSIGGPIILLTHSMSGCYGWRLLEMHGDLIEAVVGVAPSPPGNMQSEAPIYSETDEAIETLMSGQRIKIPKNSLITRDVPYVERKFIGPSRYFPHERVVDYTASLLGVPPRIAMQRWNVRGQQVRVNDPSKLAGKPILVLCGSEDLDHPREVDEPLIAWFNGYGAKAEFCFLSDRNIVGNGHMVMLENNSDEIAGVILDWIAAR